MGSYTELFTGSKSAGALTGVPCCSQTFLSSLLITIKFSKICTPYSRHVSVAIPCNKPAVTRHCALPQNETGRTLKPYLAYS